VRVYVVCKCVCAPYIGIGVGVSLTLTAVGSFVCCRSPTLGLWAAPS
jgi:hypothetical protein